MYWNELIISSIRLLIATYTINAVIGLTSTITCNLLGFFNSSASVDDSVMDMVV